MTQEQKDLLLKDLCARLPYKIVGGCARYCIPYEGNYHLLGTTEDCDDFYKL